jgi:hypothetical protein
MADPTPDLLERPPTGAVRCSLCGEGILTVADVSKEALASKVAVLHQRCFEALAGSGTRPRSTKRAKRN